ncbi:MAG: ATP-binding protein, partial [Planctomycetota bacterium]
LPLSLRPLGISTQLEEVRVSLPDEREPFAVWTRAGSAADEQGLRIWSEVRKNESVLGEVELKLSMRRARALAGYRQGELMTMMLMVLLVVIVTCLGLGWKIGGRFRALTSVLGRIRGGDYSVRAPEGTDEIGRLGSSLNRMAEQIQQQQEDLIASRDEAVQLGEIAADASAAKSTFLANMSHEMRTPMHGILNFASFGLEETTELEEVQSYFERIDRSARRLLQLLNDVLDFSKLESGKQVLDFAPAKLGDHIASVLDEFDSLLAVRGLTLRFDQRIDIEAVVDVDRIKQVVRNLVSNAIRFSPDGGVVEVAMGRREDSVLVWVADRGIGIPEDELEKVFDMFVQSSKTDKGAGGTGIGLAICREVLELHGGSIHAENREGGGARFVFEVPLDRNRQKSLAAPPEAVEERA